MSLIGCVRWIAVLGVGAAVLASACGGNTSDDDATGGKPSASGGSAGATGGEPTTGGKAVTGGASQTGGAPTGGINGTGGSVASGGAAEAGSGGEGGAALDPICSLPAHTRPGNPAFPSYYFDAELGECRPFVYGGCGGNENRFGSAADCLAACGGGTPCELSTDCVVVSAACCGPCEPVAADGLRAIHRADGGPPTCDVVCGACEDFDGVPTRGNFFAECVDARCELRDVRDTAAAECEVDADCRLRSGSECCDRCSEERPVAVGNEASLLATLNCPEDLGCPPCVSVFADYTAVCDGGRCRVEQQ